MKAKTVLIAAGSVALGVLVVFFRPDPMRHSCFDEGRKIGGMEQRAFDSASNGYPVPKEDAAAIADGPPKYCR